MTTSIPFQSLQCSLCFNDYDLESHLPKILPHCGHTLCKKCLHKLLINPEPKCPLDQKAFGTEPRTSEAFPINFSLRHLIEENLEWEVCKLHGERIKLVCLTDKCKLCAYCVVYNGHRDHEIKSIFDMKTEVDNKRVRLEEVLRSLDGYHQEIDSTFEQARVTMLKVVEDRFRELCFVMKKKKLELSFEIDTFFAQHKTRMKYLLGKDSLIRADIMVKISQYKDFVKINNLFKTLEEDISTYTSKFENDALLKGHINELNQKFSAEASAIDRSLIEQIQSFDDLKIISEDFTEELNTLYPEGRRGDIYHESADVVPLSVVKSFLKMEEKEGKTLQIAICPTESKIFVDVERWTKNITDVSIILNQHPLKEQDFQILECILKLDQIHGIHILFGCQGNMSEDCLLRILSILFWRAQALKTIEISSNRTKLGDELIVLLAERIFSKAPNLETFILDLNYTGVTDLTINAVVKTIFSPMKRLETLKLYLGETNVSEEAIKKIFICIPTLKHLLLGLGGTAITDAGLDYFAENMLLILKQLQTLELGVWSTRITDKGAACLFKNLPSVKVLRLGFRTTQITDESVRMLVQEKVPQMEDLEKLDIVLDGTLVSKEMKIQIDNAKKGLSF